MINQQQNLKQNDGFESEHDCSQNEEDRQILMGLVSNKQESKMIKEKLSIHANDKPVSSQKYSLYHDIATGWVPKQKRHTPIPLTFENDHLDKFFQSIIKNQPILKQINPKKRFSYLSKNIESSQIICYLGPRYESTFYSWYDMPFPFPYPFISPPTNMKLSNRAFNGQNPRLSLCSENILIFDSLFENGNLDCAVKIKQDEYNLYLRVDCNTKGFFQWFNFRVRNMRLGNKYKFNICNMDNNQRLYCLNMKPYMLSQKGKQKDIDWMQKGENVKYFKNTQSPYSTLSFQYTPLYDHDNVQVAYCIPYTYTDLIKFIHKLKFKCAHKTFYQQTNLCISLGGFQVPVITINERSSQADNKCKSLSPQKQKTKQAQYPKQQKQVIIIAGRIHPCSSNSSYLIQGFINFITSQKNEAKYLRSKNIFIIIPMLNIDGVCLGNSKMGLVGRDPNKQFLNPDPNLFPEIYYLKNLIAESKRQHGQKFSMFVDFHGNWNRKNVFMYGPQNSIMSKFYYESRILPKLLGKKTQMFRYYSCVFKNEESHRGTARQVFHKHYNIPLCYTIEASIGIYYNYDTLTDLSFDKIGWEQMGACVGLAIGQYEAIIDKAQKIRRERKMKNLENEDVIGKEEHFRRLKYKKKQKKRIKKDTVNIEQIDGFKQELNDIDDNFYRYIYDEIGETHQHTHSQCPDQQPNNQQQQLLHHSKLAQLHMLIKTNLQKQQDHSFSPNQLSSPNDTSRNRNRKSRFNNPIQRSKIKSSHQNYGKTKYLASSQPKIQNHLIIDQQSQPKRQSKSISKSYTNPNTQYLQSPTTKAPDNYLDTSGIMQNTHTQIAKMYKNPASFQDFVFFKQKLQKFEKTSQFTQRQIIPRSLSNHQKQRKIFSKRNSLNKQIEQTKVIKCSQYLNLSKTREVNIWNKASGTKINSSNKSRLSDTLRNNSST